MSVFSETQASELWKKYKAVAGMNESDDDTDWDDEEEEEDDDADEGEAGGDDEGLARHDDELEGDWTEEDQRNHLEVDFEENQNPESDGGGGAPDKTLGPTPMIDASVAGFEESIAERISKDTVDASKHTDYLIFTRDHDKVETYQVESGFKDIWLTRLEDETRAMTGVMQKDIERDIAARSAVVRVGGHRSGRLRGSALHRLRVQDDRVFDRKQENRSKSVEVTLLIDCSGSMAADRKIQIAFTAAFALSTTLERVGIKHEVIGFTTGMGGNSREDAERLAEDQKRIKRSYTRHEPIWMPIFKGHGERLSSDVRKRFADAPQNMSKRNNIDGESVEYAAMRLLARKADRHVLIVLSDGNPACHGDLWALERHLKSTVEQLERRGVETIGIGICDDSVRKFYKKNMVLRNALELPRLVMTELRRVLTPQ